MADLNTIINHLTLEQAQSVLRAITAENPAIAERAIEIALAQRGIESWEDVAYGLVDGLEYLKPEEVWDRAGPTRDGYVDTPEAAEEMIEEVVAEYLTEMKRYHALGMKQEASELCKGLAAGFYRFAHQSKSEFKNWAGDGPQAFAESAVELWKEGSPSDAEWQSFIDFNQDELNGWLTYSVRSRV